MTARSWTFPLGTLILGLILGTLWSPRAKAPSEEELQQAAARHASKSSNHSSAGFPASSTNSATRSRSSNQQDSSLYHELTVENLILSFSSLESEEELNPMELARYGAQLANMDEFAVTALLTELKGPFEEEQEHMAEIAQVLSIIVFTRLCELNGPEAMRMLHAGELGEDAPDEAATLGMNAWVAADPEGAKRWFEGAMNEVDQLILAGGDEENLTGPAALIESTDLASAYLRGMTAIDPEAIKNNLSKIQSEDVRDYMQEELAHQLVEQARTKEELLKLLQDETYGSSEDIQTSLIQKLSTVDTAEAVRWVESQEPSSGRDDMIATVANELLQKNPSEGAAWYQSQELSPNSTEADRLQHITNRWMHRDIEDAATWLLEQPNTSQRDSSESSLAAQSARTGEWEAAFRWHSDISDPQLRQTSQDQVLRQAWDRRSNTFNPEAYRAAQEAGFGEEADAYIQSYNQPTQGGGSLDGRSRLGR